MIKKYWLLGAVMIPLLLSAQTSDGAPQTKVVPKWKTTGLRQANSMGGGAAAISRSGKFRVFVLMAKGQETPPISILGLVSDLRRAGFTYLSRLISCHFLRNLLIPL